MAVSSGMKKFLCLVAPLMLGLTGILLISTHRQIFHFIYKSNLVLAPGSASFPMWRQLPVPMLASIYLFKVKNPEAVSGGARPVVEEVGPYVFTEQHTKTGIVWNDNGTVTYKQIRTWHFMSELSAGSLEDEITILNPVSASLGPMINQHVADFWRPGLDGILKLWKNKLFVTKTVREIIFDGYHDPLFDHVEDIEQWFPFIKKFIPEGTIMDKFAFFYGRNGTDWTDGVWNMFTGAGNTNKMGKVYSWNYSSRGYFPGQCGAVRGGAGEFYPPGLDKTFIEMFSNDLCRTLRFNFAREVSVHGIPSYEFSADKSFLANGTENPANACYEPAGAALPSGVYNSSLCRFGAPVFISQPHFYQADPYFAGLVDGLTPNASLHGTVFRVEPRAGVPTDVTARFQLNVMVEPVDHITMFESLQPAFIPVMWFENKAGVPADMVTEMRLLASLPEILQGAGWTQLGLAAAILIMAALQLVSKRRSREEDRSPILSQSLQDDTQDENVFVDEKEED